MVTQGLLYVPSSVLGMYRPPLSTSSTGSISRDAGLVLDKFGIDFFGLGKLECLIIFGLLSFMEDFLPPDCDLFLDNSGAILRVFCVEFNDMADLKKIKIGSFFAEPINQKFFLTKLLVS